MKNKKITRKQKKLIIFNLIFAAALITALSINNKIIRLSLISMCVFISLAESKNILKWITK